MIPFKIIIGALGSGACRQHSWFLHYFSGAFFGACRENKGLARGLPGACRGLPRACRGFLGIFMGACWGFFRVVQPTRAACHRVVLVFSCTQQKSTPVSILSESDRIETKLIFVGVFNGVLWSLSWACWGLSTSCHAIIAICGVRERCPRQRDREIERLRD